MTGSETPPPDDAVERAAEHAQRSIAERRARQRTAAQAEAAEGEDERSLRRESDGHAEAAIIQEQRAQQAADAADAGSQ